MPPQILSNLVREGIYFSLSPTFPIPYFFYSIQWSFLTFKLEVFQSYLGSLPCLRIGGGGSFANEFL